nr:uncharacterized protein LOC101239472 [Hydra vulgaris]
MIIPCIGALNLNTSSLNRIEVGQYVNIDITPNPILLNCIPCSSDQSAGLPFYDVSTYYECSRQLSVGKDDSMLLDLVNKIFIPNSSFVFPISGEKKKRSFLHKWLLEYSWLAYSQIEDGAYCLPCTLLGSRIPNNTLIINFIQKPFKIWGNAIRAYMDHNNHCRLHQMSMHCLNMLQSRYNSKKNLIEFDIDNQRKKLIISHRDDSKYHPEIGETCKNNIGIGNFVELLNFRIEAGDKVLEHHIRSAPKNATYISKTTQNELIECCGKTIKEVLINKIKKSDFLQFIECKSGTTGLSLGQNIVSAIDDLGLDIQKCRGQGYDGAGAMSGKLKGISSRIKFINSKAIFVHCACHKLNLVVSKSCNVQSVRNVLDQIKDISYFFNLSPKRASCLNKFIFPGQAKLIDTCRTRWVQKLKGLDVFFENYISVFHSMEEMTYNEILTKQIMDYFYAITVVLQTKAFDISQQSKTLDVSEVKLRLCGRQIYRDNYPSVTVSDYFKYSITSPLLDHLMNELEDRFDKGDMVVYKGLSDLWETFWNNQSVIPSTITETLKSIDMRGFQNIREGFLIMGTIPITTCECERSISVIRRLKTYMTESRFNSLALMSIPQEIIPDVERVMNIFSVLGERRLELFLLHHSCELKAENDRRYEVEIEEKRENNPSTSNDPDILLTDDVPHRLSQAELSDLVRDLELS